jgi:fructose-1,6-bisphosphatase
VRRGFFLVLLISIITGIQPVFSQSGSEAYAKPAATEKTVQEGETVININLASDDEFTQALESAGDVELVNEETEKTEKSDKDPDQGKAK